MSDNEILSRAVRCALFANAAAVAVAGTAMAAEPAKTDTNLQEVVVTGTRIAQPNLESVSPVTTISNEEFKFQGTTRVEDLLNNLPQVMADFGGNLSNGATGEATVNLRGLGSQRTLVLVNGRRLMPGDPTQNGNAAPDLNQIPAALVDRVDVLTGGASAVYGADAVAGVVNFVMNDHFEGVRLDANYSFYQHSQHSTPIANAVTSHGYPLPDSNVRDGYAKDVTFILGGNFADGQGNVTAYLGYRNLSALAQAKRDFSACTIDSADLYRCGGSSTAATGRFLPNDGGNYTIGAGGALRPFTTADRYNYAPTNYYQRPDERYTGGLFGHYDISEHAKAYTELSFMDDRTRAQVAPSGAFLGSGTGVDATGIPDGTWLVNCDNPFLSPSAKTAFCVAPDGVTPLGPTDTAHVTFGRRNVEGGNRTDDLGHTSFRGVIGLKGDIVGPWKYDVYGLFGTTRYSENYTNDVSKSRLTNALQVVIDPATGQPTCKANVGGTLNAPGCVPYNIFQPGGVTPAALAYISIPSFQKGSTDERIVSGSITGDLGEYGVKLPSASNGLAVAFGAEYRQERTELTPDIVNITNDLAGQGAPTLPTKGQLNVRELFAEARLPIAQDLPFAHALSLEAGYRYSDYDLGFKTNTYKFGVEWSPVADIGFRASYQKAIRAPNLQELFLPPKVQNDGSTDPCSGTIDPATGLVSGGATLAQCARTGVTAAQYGTIVANSAAQYNGLTSGNLALQPEVSDTKSFGIILTPSFVPKLSITIDYFDIKIKKIISTYGADFTINNCLQTGDPFFCGFVHRAAGSGSLWLSPSGYIQDGTFNLGGLAAKGADVSADYKVDMAAAGHLSFSFIGSYVKNSLTQSLPGGSSYDCVGLYGSVCGRPLPKWRHKLRTTWMTPVEGLDVSLNWRHLNSVKLDHSSADPVLTGPVALTDARLGSRDYLDLAGAFHFHKVTARMGINNLFDKDPPTFGSNNQAGLAAVFANGNTFPGTYDTLGRAVYFNVTADF